MIKPDQKYRGFVAEGAWIKSQLKGTIGFELTLQCDDGVINFIIWVTESNRENVNKNFTSLGIDTTKLSDPEYRAGELLSDVRDAPITFGTVAEEYNGKTRIKVKWIGKTSASNQEAAAEAGLFFGDKSPF